MKIYCTECGEGIEYTLKKPNFCPECRNPLTAEGKTILSQKSKVKAKVAPPEDLDEDVEEDEEEEITPRALNRTDVSSSGQMEVEIVRKPRASDKLWDLAISPNNGTERIQREKSTKKINKKAFLEEFKKEAGTLRKG